MPLAGPNTAAGQHVDLGHDMSRDAFAEDVNVELSPFSQSVPFGLIALLGATISVIFCYGQILISLVTPLFGMEPFELNTYFPGSFHVAIGISDGLWTGARPGSRRQRDPPGRRHRRCPDHRRDTLHRLRRERAVLAKCGTHHAF